ncbi:MAG: site-specific recombinase [Blastocatellia bacterium]
MKAPKKTDTRFLSHLSQQKVALIYCRVSTAKQDEEGTSLDSQEKANIEEAKRRGYAIGRVDREVYSGAELYDRPLLSRARSEIRAGKFHALIVYSTDRLSRDPIHLAIIAEECERHGVELIFVSEPFDNSHEGALLRYVKGYAAQVEREKFRERIIRGKRERFLQGKLNRAGCNLYGYCRDAEGTKREIVPNEAKAIRQIFEWALEGVGQVSIAKRLNERGVRPPSFGKKTYKDGRLARWGKGQISRILREPAYRGETIGWRWKSNGKHSNVTLRPKEDHIRLPEGISPRIVSDELWYGAQARIAQSYAVVNTRNEKQEFLLRGMIVCGKCGRSLYTEVEHKKTRIYRCSSRVHDAKPCGGKRANADFIEQKVWARVLAFLSNPDVAQEELEKLESESADDSLRFDLDAAQKRMESIDRRIRTLVRKLATVDDEDVERVFDQEIGRLKEEKGQTARIIEDIETRLASKDSALASLRTLTDYCARVRAVVDNFSFEEKTFTLQTLGVKVAANGKQWHMDMKIRLAEPDMAAVGGNDGGDDSGFFENLGDLPAGVSSQLHC